MGREGGMDLREVRGGHKSGQNAVRKILKVTSKGKKNGKKQNKTKQTNKQTKKTKPKRALEVTRQLCLPTD